MTLGLSVTNTSGTIQIDQDFSVLVLVDSGQVLATPSGVGAGIVPWDTWNATYGGVGQEDRYRVVFRSDTYGVPFADGSGEPQTQSKIWALSNILVDYKVYVPLTNAQINADDYGLDVYKSDGGVSFSSRVDGLMNINSVLFSPEYWYTAQHVTRDYPLTAAPINKKLYTSINYTRGGDPDSSPNKFKAVAFTSDTNLRWYTYKYPAGNYLSYEHTLYVTEA